MPERGRRLPGAPQQLHVVVAGAHLGVGHAVPQLERALQQRHRLAVRVDALGGAGRVHRPLERGGLLAGGGEVVGHGGGQDGAGLLVDALLERAGERQVEGGALTGQQVVLDHLAQQRVAEAVAAVVVGDQDVVVDRLAQRVAKRALVEAAGLRQQRVVGALGNGDEPQDLLRGLGQALDAQHQRVAQRVRRGAAAVEAGGEQLLAVQRVAARALPQPLQQVGLGRRAEDVGELVGQLGARERLERDAARVRSPLELGQQRAQRVAPVQLVGPVGADDRARARRPGCGPGTRAPRESSGRPSAGPRSPAARAARRRARRAAAAGPRRAVPGRRPRRTSAAGASPGSSGATAARTGSVERRVAGAGERAQRGHERHVRQLALAEVDAVAGQDERAALDCLALELGEQARLADAGLTGQEQHRRPALLGVGQRSLELRQLGGTADQAGARDSRARLSAYRSRARRS